MNRRAFLASVIGAAVAAKVLPMVPAAAPSEVFACGFEMGPPIGIQTGQIHGLQYIVHGSRAQFQALERFDYGSGVALTPDHFERAKKAFLERANR